MAAAPLPAGPCPSAAPWPADPEPRLAGLLAAQAPLRRTLARLAARLVAIRGWERLGFARLGDYARERLGRSARQLQELAHVDRALAALPRIDAALRCGELSWTKARLLCRVATPADERAWLAAAGRLTARSLAREVRAVDRRSLEAGGASCRDGDEELLDGEPRETVRIRCGRAGRAKWWRARQLARRVAGEPLPPWACLEAVAAEVLSAIPVAAEAEPAAGDARPPGSAPSRDPRGDALGRRLPAAASATHAALEPPLLEDLSAELDSADARELDRRLRRALALEQRLLAEMGPLLLAVVAERRYRDLGLASLDAYARERLGWSPSKARALVRLERACLVGAPLREAWRAGALSWAQAHALVPLVLLAHSLPWQAAWVERARQVTLRRLEDDVERALATGDLDPGPLSPGPLSPGGPAGRQTGAQPRHAHDPELLFVNAPRDVARLFRATLASVQRWIERARGSPATESEAFEAMLDHVFQAWQGDARVPRAHRVFARDGWRCTVPGCRSYRNLHDHHIVFRAAGGGDDLSNRVTLCAWHHLRGVHRGLVRIAGRAPDGLRFALPVGAYRSGDVRV